MDGMEKLPRAIQNYQQAFRKTGRARWHRFARNIGCCLREDHQIFGIVAEGPMTALGKACVDKMCDTNQNPLRQYVLRKKGLVNVDASRSAPQTAVHV